MNKKIIFIDYLKIIGLYCIILAHICPNQYILQIRNFDVPLMVMISGFLAFESYNNTLRKEKNVKKYCYKRFKRLLLPTWVFLTFYFIFVKIFFLNTEYPYDWNTIVRSFFLLDGIGYVWVIRVYIMCSFLTPIIFYLNNRIKNKRLKFSILLIIYVLYEILVFCKFNKLNIFFEYVLAYIIPYGIIYILGIYCKKSDYKKDIKISILFFIIFIIMFSYLYLHYKTLKSTQIMKYPPTAYYLSYALFVAFLLFGISKRINLKYNKMVDFCSRSSLWIYLWHIAFLNLVNIFLSKMNWIINFVIICICAIGLTYIQNKVIDNLQKTKINKEILKIFRG